MRNRCDCLFVYGTLRPAAGHPLQRWLQRHAVWIGPARCQGRLYDLGRYPGLVPSEQASDVVHGDLFRLREPAALLPILDRYEGCAPRMPVPREFVRRRIEVAFRERVVNAWIYLYTQPTRGRMRIMSGDYLGAGEAAGGRRRILRRSISAATPSGHP